MQTLVREITVQALLQAAEPLCVRGHLPPFSGAGASARVAPLLAKAQGIVGKKPPARQGNAALAPVFDHLEGKKLRHSMASLKVDALPQTEGAFGSALTVQDYAEAAETLRRVLDEGTPDRAIPRLLAACEDTMTYAPVYPGDREDGDLSLYDYGRMTAALAGCLALLQSEGAENANTGQTLLLFSCDFSGIQSFLYLIATKSALKMLRSRSFFLELLMEYCVDELLDACGLTRANCIYSGGGHAYLLLPNSAAARAQVKNFDAQINSWLAQSFGAELFMASGAQPCTPAALFGREGPDAYRAVFRQLSASISGRKIHRYTAEQLRRMNSSEAGQDGRECRICGKASGVQDSDGLCSRCGSLVAIARSLTLPDAIFAISETPAPAGGISMPSLSGRARSLLLTTTSQAEQLQTRPGWVRCYCKNGLCPNLTDCIRLWVGDWCPGSMMSELSEQASGVRRLGVFRADVDNLGHAFSNGFDAATAASGGSAVSLLRTAAFSHSMTLFFKKYINTILTEQPSAEGTMIVYSGGDDLFLVGAWDSVLDVAQLLRKKFGSYCGGTLTFSGGFGLFDDHYPLIRAAEDTAALEDFSKKLDGKDAVTLFMPQEGLRFHWKDFEENVWLDKYQLLECFFAEEEAQRGMAYLYHLLGYLRAARDDKLNLARCAYLLARLQPSGKEPQRQEAYAKFSKNFYAWACDDTARGQLIAAIYLYSYLHREASKE